MLVYLARLARLLIGPDEPPLSAVLRVTLYVRSSEVAASTAYDPAAIREVIVVGGSRWRPDADPHCFAPSSFSLLELLVIACLACL